MGWWGEVEMAGTTVTVNQIDYEGDRENNAATAFEIIL